MQSITNIHDISLSARAAQSESLTESQREAAAMFRAKWATTSMVEAGTTCLDMGVAEEDVARLIRARHNQRTLPKFELVCDRARESGAVEEVDYARTQRCMQDLRSRLVSIPYMSAGAAREAARAYEAQVAEMKINDEVDEAEFGRDAVLDSERAVAREGAALGLVGLVAVIEAILEREAVVYQMSREGVSLRQALEVSQDVVSPIRAALEGKIGMSNAVEQVLSMGVCGPKVQLGKTNIQQPLAPTRRVN